ncbi:O-acetyltransferase OatA [Comamonadaceae bacterium OS-1]|nr:O-acetyltransferase OatA [Comamonadaceae bacterium OS-1]
MHSHTERNHWLDFCRSIAILLVLLSHGRKILPEDFLWREYLRFGGFIGVELFFVLSGYLIGGILIRTNKQENKWINNFYLRRWFRTIPNYYLFILINIILIYTEYRPGTLSDIGYYVFFSQNLFSPHPSFFPEAWSLAVEEIFYLTYPLTLLFFIKILKIEQNKAMLLSSILVIVASLIGRISVANHVFSWDEGIRKIVFLRFDALMLGVLLALWKQKNKKPNTLIINFGIFIFFASIVYIAITPNKILDDSMFSKTILFNFASLGCAAVVISGLQLNFPEVWANFFNILAKISFSAYLLNLPILSIINKINQPLPWWQVWLQFITFTLLASYMVYKYFEKPTTDLRDYIKYKTQKPSHEQ